MKRLATIEKATRIPAPASRVFAWRISRGAFARLTPPWRPIRVIASHGDVTDGGDVTLEFRRGPWREKMKVGFEGYTRDRGYRARQSRGALAQMLYQFEVLPQGDESSVMTERIEWRPPLGSVGSALVGRALAREIQRTLVYRQAIVSLDVGAHLRWRERIPQRILVSGSRGLVGSELVSFLRAGGHDVSRLIRSEARREAGDIAWNPSVGVTHPVSVEGVDAIIHLAGEPIFGRWTEHRMAQIRDSRVNGTRTLCESVAKLSHPPRVIICASAVGVYGERGDEILTEASAPGNGFLSAVAQEWEEATASARAAGIRVVHARFGMIMTARGGALAVMRLPFSLGLGGPLGSGKQWMSWIGLDDTVYALYHLLMDDGVVGPVNVVSPQPVTNAEFTATLARVMRRPAFLPAPEFALRAIFGQLVENALVASHRALPTRLLSRGYTFAHPTLETALRHTLGRLIPENSFHETSA